MKKLLEMAELHPKEDLVIVTVVETQGSTPRKLGATMLLGKTGLLYGTIGGGALEKEAMTVAQAMLGKNIGKVIQYSLNDEESGEIGMICGGNTKILYTPISELDDILWEDKKMAFSLPLDGGKPCFLPLSLNFPSINFEKNTISFPYVEGGRVFLFGAGHVSQALARLLMNLEFPLIVIDDREDFCNPKAFPIGELCQIKDFSALKNTLKDALYPREEDAICIMTRGHQGDLDCIRFALTSPVSYIGVMGSRRKKEKVFDILEKEGFTEARNRVKTPIGLEISAETPEELSISVAGELIAWRAARRKESCS
ncbi:MAG: XdhC family protein [Eubacteriales bacterium]